MIDDEIVSFNEQWPGIDSIPHFAEWSGDGQFCLALFQDIEDMASGRPPDRQPQARKGAGECPHLTGEQRNVDTPRDDNRQRGDIVLDHGTSQSLGRGGGGITLLQQR